MLKHIATLSLILLLIGCKEDEFVFIPDNSAPTDNTVENITIENYITKSFISLIGRDPLDAEIDSALAILHQNSLSIDNRKEFIQSLLTSSEYYVNEYSIIREYYLQGTDTIEFRKRINNFNNAIDKTTDTAEIALYENRIIKMERLFYIPAELEAGSINFVETDYRCIDNLEYDQQNAGAENYVVSLFQNFLFRYPTSSELSSSVNMVNGIHDVVFLKTANSKTEFNNIFFQSDEYFEGKVRTMFLRFLYREPTNTELSSATESYQTTLNYNALQESILICDEYIGL